MREGIPLRKFLLRTLVCMAGLAVLGAVLIVGVGLWIIARDSAPVVVATIDSPDGRVQAILKKNYGGATDGAGYFISLNSVSAGGKALEVASLDSPLKAKDTEGLALVWVNDQTLEIRYLAASSAKLEKSNATVDGRVVTVRLASGWPDIPFPPSAPR
jgi:hypothetical protein